MIMNRVWGVAIRLATNKDPVLRVFLDVGGSMEVRVAVDLGQLAPAVEATPQVRAAIAVLIVGSHVDRRPHLDGSEGGAR